MFANYEYIYCGLTSANKVYFIEENDSSLTYETDIL
jgi:hypothetical protein